MLNHVSLKNQNSVGEFHGSKTRMLSRTDAKVENQTVLSEKEMLKVEKTSEDKNLFGDAATLELSHNFTIEKVSSTNMAIKSKVGSRTLKVGSRGEDVKKLQENLNTLGYNAGKADGIFGNGTKNAVIAFQKAKGLTADGIVGTKTQNAITKALNEKATASSNILKVGSKGAKVTSLQKNLNALGYNAGTADGVFGNGTKNTVISFQKTYGLSADGIVGKNTQDAINKTINYKKKGVLAKGQVSNDVKNLQKDLKTLGFLSGTVDGAFGKGTEAAVKAFQKKYGLAQDGLVGSATRAKITSEVKAKGKTKPATPTTPTKPTTPSNENKDINRILTNLNKGINVSNEKR